MKKTLQELLDAYGASTQCVNWMGWVGECIQHPDMVVNKFNEIVKEFRKENENQIEEALNKLKDKCYGDNWPRNSTHYKNLFGENNGPNEFIEGKN